MNRKLVSIVTVILALLVAVAAFSTSAQQEPAQPAVSTSAVYQFSDNAEIEGAFSELTRFDNGVTVTLNTSALVPGEVYTLWWVIFNAPENCSEGACNMDDIFIIDENGEIARDEVGNRALNFDALGASNISIQHASGTYSTDGTASMSASLGLGEVPGIVLGPGLLDGYSSEVHLVVRTHGEKLDEFFNAQIATFGGGCDPIDVAPCDDVQYAFHMPVVR